MASPQPPKPPDSEKIDPLLESLLAKARPIIAEERGLNHRSRVKIQSLGKQLKLPAAVIDQALQLLHGMPPVQGLGEKSTETQYEKAFAKTMARKIASIPGNILTTKIEEKAISIGTRKYQLSETQARNIIRRVAEEVGVPRVSLTEAERHMEQEISEAVGDATWVTGEVKTRLIRNAKRLGVTHDQAESMIQRHLQFNFKQVQFERKLTDRLWVVAACIVVGTGLSIFVFFQLKKAKKENEAFTKANEEKKITEDPDELLDKELKTPDWWDDSLKVQLQKTRLKVSGFPDIHDRMKSRNHVTRSRAYKDLFSLGLGKVNPQVVRQRVALVIPGLYQSDPKIEATAGMITGFQNAIKMPVGKVPTSRDFYTKAFWALGLLNQMVGDESLDDQKVVAIQNMIESVTGRNFDLFLSNDSRLSKQKRALLEKYFKQMADIGDAFPSVAPESFEMLEELAKDELSADRIQNMRTMFLTAILKSNDENWSNCSSLIKRTIDEASSSEISFFIDKMETTSVEPLQIYLEEALLARAGLGDDFESINELAERLREYFEIGKPVETEKRPDSGERIVKTLEQFNSKWIVSPTKLDNRRSAQLLVDSVYATTLLIIFNSDESEALDRMLKAGFPQLEDPKYLNEVMGIVSDDDPSIDEAGTTEKKDPAKQDAQQRVARQRMNEALAQLNRYKILTTDRRVVALTRVRELASVLNRLDGTQASILAEYLFARKNPQERNIVINFLPEFRKWPRLLVALSDLLDQNTLARQTCLDVSSQLLNEDILLDGPDWHERLARRLKVAASEQLKIRNTKPKEGEDSDPVGTLKSLLEYFYRLRVRAVLTKEKLPKSSDLQSSLDFLIEVHRKNLLEKGNASLISELQRRTDIVAVLGNDPLTRIQLKQQALLVGRELGSDNSLPGSEPEILSKLKRLAKSRFNKMNSVVGQIAENEVQLLLNYYPIKIRN